MKTAELDEYEQMSKASKETITRGEIIPLFDGPSGWVVERRAGGCGKHGPLDASIARREPGTRLCDWGGHLFSMDSGGSDLAHLMLQLAWCKPPKRRLRAGLPTPHAAGSSSPAEFEEHNVRTLLHAL